MVRFDGVESSISRDHAVPRAVRFKVVGLMSLGRVVLLEGAKICDLCPTTVGIDADHSVVCSLQPMRTTRSCQERVKVTVDERHIRDATYQIAERIAGLAGGQVVGHGRDYPAGVYFRNALP